MKRPPLPLLLAVLLAAVASVSALAALNPHVEPASCPSCHTKVPTEDEGRVGDYFLIKDTIDETCETCHPYTCCEVGSLHTKASNHPSHIRTWDKRVSRQPRKLPLFNGYITCDTCHFHREAQGNTYKLVRIAKQNAFGYEWTELCHDCHEDY